MTKTPLGGERTGKNPTDRGKLGVKRSVATDCRGVPLGIAVAGTSRIRAKSNHRVAPDNVPAAG
jgi:putative transposase